MGVVSSNGGKVKWISAGGGSDGELPLGNDPNVLIPRFGWVRDGTALGDGAESRAGPPRHLFHRCEERQVTAHDERDQRCLDRHASEIDFALLPSGDRYLWTSWRDGHNHIYLYQFDKQNPLTGEAKLVAQLTHGDWEVESIDGIDEAQGMVYFTANEGDWRQANIYAVGLDGKNFHRVSKEDGAHAANFDPAKTKYYVDTYSALDHAAQAVALHDRGRLHCVLAAAQRRSITTCLRPSRWSSRPPTAQRKLLGTMLLPEGGPMMANGKAPLIVNPYGGPGAQTVRDAWGGDSSLFDRFSRARDSPCCTSTIAAWQTAARPSPCR